MLGAVEKVLLPKVGYISIHNLRYSLIITFKNPLAGMETRPTAGFGLFQQTLRTSDFFKHSTASEMQEYRWLRGYQQ